MILTDRAIAEGHTDLEVLVDNEVSRENVNRIAHKRGLKTEVGQEGADIIVRAKKA